MSEILRVGILTPVELFDPRSAYDFANILVSWHLYQTPMRPAAAEPGVTEPVLFEGPLESRSESQRTWAGRLREGLRFSDGSAVDAETLAACLRQSKALSHEAEISVRGEELLFELRRPHRRFDCLLCHHTCALTREAAGQWLGSGPYRVVSNAPEKLRLARNPYFEPAPPIEEIELTVYPADPDGRPRALMAAIDRGEVDFTLALSRDDLREVRRVHKWMGQGDATAYLYFNVQRPPLGRASLRRALALAIDRRALAARSYASPMAFAGSGFLPPSLALMPDGLQPDPERARAQLAGERVPERPLSMLVVPFARPHLPHPKATADLLIEQFAAVGVEVVATPTANVHDYMNRLVAGDYDLALSGWMPDTPDLAGFFEAVLDSRSVPETHEAALVGANLSRWRHEPMDQALEAYRRDPVTRHLYEINEILSAERPLVPLLYGSEVVIYSWRLKERPSALFNRPFFTEMRL
ncbi:MAG: ABC transporter substrate-binding protein [Acidobacteriota bacterium]